MLKLRHMFFKYFFKENKILQLWLKSCCAGPEVTIYVKLEAFSSMILMYIFIFSLQVYLFTDNILGRPYINDTMLNFYFLLFFFCNLPFYSTLFLSRIYPDWKFIHFNYCILSYCVNIPTEGQFDYWFLFVFLIFSLLQLYS